MHPNGQKFVYVFHSFPTGFTFPKHMLIKYCSFLVIEKENSFTQKKTSTQFLLREHFYYNGFFLLINLNVELFCLLASAFLRLGSNVVKAIPNSLYCKG